jgi:Mrp family chromosome partitioning ATPase
MEPMMIKKVEENDQTQNTQVAILTDPTATEIKAIEQLAKAEKKVKQKKTQSVQKPAPAPSKRAQEEAHLLRIRCKQLCVTTFFQSHTSIRSLGFTSSISGEGKSFLARLAAEVMAEDDSIPVTLLECNWENADFSTVFHLPQGPGLADWLRNDCNLSAIRHQVHPNLTVIPAGNSKNNAIGLLRTLQQHGVHDLLTQPNELLIVDLPAITTTPYGQLAASLFDSLILVVRMGVTPESFISEANSMLKDLPVEGIIFNQAKSVIPSWLRQIM